MEHAEHLFCKPRSVLGKPSLIDYQNASYMYFVLKMLYSGFGWVGVEIVKNNQKFKLSFSKFL